MSAPAPSAAPQVPAPVALVRGVVVRAANDDVTGVASQFAYNAFLATVPFLFVIVSVAGLLVDPVAFERALSEDDSVVPEALRSVLVAGLRSAAENSGQAAAFLVLGFLGAMYVMSNVTGALIGGLDRARGVPHRSFLRGRLVALGFAFGTIVLVVGAALALIGGPRLVAALIEEAVGGSPDLGLGIVLAVATTALALFTLLLFRYGPNAPGRGLARELPGALVTVALWVGAMLLFALYLGNFDQYRSVYGSLGAFVIYLIFLFISAVVLLVGAEVNEELAAHRAGHASRETDRV